MDGKTFYLGHELNPKEYQEYPLPWDRIFSSAGPLAVEIGFGNGEFLMNWARQQPDWNFVGVELSLASMERILKRIHQSGIRNVKPIHEDARFAIREFFPDNSIRHVMMNFPDPWFKERHKHRRLLNESFIRTLAAVLEN
ncbi:MAG: tRNA (guanosine(46)-N7)-methyltransferase TrmB, partial [Calditrichaeota bacterium]